MNSWNISEQAIHLHNESIVMDMTMPMIPKGKFSNFFSTLDTMYNNGVKFVSLTVASDHTSTKEAMGNIRLMRMVLLGRMGKIRLVRNVDDIYEAARENKLAVGLHFQGTMPIGNDLSMVGKFYKKGIRHMLMAYNSQNLVGYGCHEAEDKGLTTFGRNLIREMNRVGMLVDVAHTGQRTALETIEISEKPVVVSHGNIWALHQHVRCVKDDLIKAIANNNGVIGITGYGVFLGDNNISTENYVKNIDYVAQLVGVQHVGIGLDYVYDMESFVNFARRHPEQYPQDGGYFDEVKQVEYRQIPQITEALLKLGYDDRSIRGILGENWLRVLKDVWR